MEETNQLTSSQTSQGTEPKNIQLPSIEMLLKDSMRSYAEYFLDIVKIGLVPTLLLIVSVFLFTVRMPNNPLKPLAILVIGFASYLSTVAFLAMIVRKLHAKDAWRSAWSVAIPLIGVGILVSLAELGGIILLLIPGIIAYVHLLFTMIIVVAEDKRGFDALVASWEYVRGNAWKVFWRMLVLGVMIAIIGAIVGAILAAGGEGNGGYMFGGNESVSSYLNVRELPVNIFSYFVFTPIATIYMYHLYVALSKEKGMIDLESVSSKKTRTRIKLLSLLGALAIPVALMLLGGFIFFQLWGMNPGETGTSLPGALQATLVPYIEMFK